MEAKAKSAVFRYIIATGHAVGAAAGMDADMDSINSCHVAVCLAKLILAHNS